MIERKGRPIVVGHDPALIKGFSSDMFEVLLELIQIIEGALGLIFRLWHSVDPDSVLFKGFVAWLGHGNFDIDAETHIGKNWNLDDLSSDDLLD